MALKAHHLRPAPGAKTDKHRVGRGEGGKGGKTAGRGHKGQKARAGYKALPIFQGTGSPLVRRIPKRGFTNVFALNIAEINVQDLEANFDAGAEVTPETLREKKLLRVGFAAVAGVRVLR